MSDFDLKRRTLENSEESATVAWAENNGWVVRKMKYIGRRGCPDRFFFGYGQILMLEFKRLEEGRESKTSENQVREHERLADVGCPVYTFYTSSSAIDFLKRRM